MARRDREREQHESRQPPAHAALRCRLRKGPAKPSGAGMNTAAPVCEQQSGPNLVQVLPAGATGSVAAVSPKPARGNG